MKAVFHTGGLISCMIQQGGQPLEDSEPASFGWCGGDEFIIILRLGAEVTEDEDAIRGRVYLNPRNPVDGPRVLLCRSRSKAPLRTTGADLTLLEEIPREEWETYAPELQLARQIARDEWPEWEEAAERAGVPVIPLDELDN